MGSTWQLKRASFTAIQRPSWSACRCVRSNSRCRAAPSSSNSSKQSSEPVRGARAIAPIFCGGLAFTGCRKGEAAEMRWRDLDFAAGEIVGRGDPETGTKNWTVRRVPMIPDARTLFGQMHSERNAESPNEKVFRVNEAQKEQLPARHANSVFRASPTRTFGICLPPSESKPESRSQPSPAGSGIKTAARSP